MNVVVPPNVACTPAATKKIRRKPENKVKKAGENYQLASLEWTAADLSEFDICFLSCQANHKFVSDSTSTSILMRQFVCLLHNKFCLFFLFSSLSILSASITN
jgi:hypothetical protein